MDVVIHMITSSPSPWGTIISYNSSTTVQFSNDIGPISNEMKILMIIPKSQECFLTHTKAIISLELLKVPITTTYENALAILKNKFNSNFPPYMSMQELTRCNIQDMNQDYSSCKGFERGG